MAPKLPRPGTLFLIANAALVALLVTTVLVAASADVSTGGRGGPETVGQKSVMIYEYFVDPGDQIRIPTPWAFNAPIKEHVSFYVVEGGYGEAFINGGTPDYLYHSDPEPLEIDAVWIDRPTPPEGKAHESLEGWNPPVDTYDGIEIIYIFDRSDVPSGDLASMNRRWSEATSRGMGMYSGVLFSNSIVIADGGTLLAVSVLTFLVWTAAASVVVSGLYWFLRRGAKVDMGPTGPTEDLIRLAESARRYLRHLRVMGLLNGALVLLGGVFGLTAANYYMSSYYEFHPSADWNLWMMVFAWVAFFGLVIAWFVHYRALSNEFRRVEKRFSAPPIVG